MPLIRMMERARITAAKTSWSTRMENMRICMAESWCSMLFVASRFSMGLSLEQELVAMLWRSLQRIYSRLWDLRTFTM